MMHIELPAVVQDERDLTSLTEGLLRGESNELIKEFWIVNPRLSSDSKHTKYIVKQLQEVIAKNLRMTITFAQSGDDDFYRIIVGWVRKNIHHYMLVTFLTDPLITGGCIVRTSQHQYDWSWSNVLESNKNQLYKAINHVS